MLDLGDPTLVDVEFSGDLAALPAEVVQQPDHAILPRGKAATRGLPRTSERIADAGWAGAARRRTEI